MTGVAHGVTHSYDESCGIIQPLEPCRSVLLQASSITKAFAGVRALRGVSFELRAGEVHALIGENGAGKSTLIKIITGAETADSGELEVSGSSVRHMDPATSRALGIAAIYQQPSLFPDLTVAENIALALERRSVLDADRLARPHDPRSRALAPRQRLHRSAAARRVAEHARAAARRDRQGDRRRRQDRDHGRADRRADGTGGPEPVRGHPRACATRASASSTFRTGWRKSSPSRTGSPCSGTVKPSRRWRDRRRVPARADPDDGRPGADNSLPQARRSIGEVALELRGVSNDARRRARRVADGAAGGDPRPRRARRLGPHATRRNACSASRRLTPARSSSTERPCASRRRRTPSTLGIAYVPEDRRRHGVVLEMSVAENASLASLPRLSRHGWLDRAAEERSAARSRRPTADQDRVGARGGRHAVGRQSAEGRRSPAGSSTAPSVLILDEPTQGVDVGSKAEIHGLMQDAGRAGSRHHHDFFRAAGNSRDERSHRRDARRDRAAACSAGRRRRRRTCSRWRRAADDATSAADIAGKSPSRSPAPRSRSSSSSSARRSSRGRTPRTSSSRTSPS